MKHARLASLDMYRKVPIDLLEGSKQGSIISWIALFVIATLFFLETKAFFTPQIQQDLALDKTNDKLLRVNFVSSHVCVCVIGWTLTDHTDVSIHSRG